jgi:hypothetical protein
VSAVSAAKNRACARYVRIVIVFEPCRHPGSPAQVDLFGVSRCSERNMAKKAELSLMTKELDGASSAAVIIGANPRCCVQGSFQRILWTRDRIANCSRIREASPLVCRKERERAVRAPTTVLTLASTSYVRQSRRRLALASIVGVSGLAGSTLVNIERSAGLWTSTWTAGDPIKIAGDLDLAQAHRAALADGRRATATDSRLRMRSSASWMSLRIASPAAADFPAMMASATFL